MADYHLRQRDGTTIDRVIQAKDDAEALLLMSAILIDRDSELRCGERCVALLAVGRQPLIVNTRPSRP